MIFLVHSMGRVGSRSIYYGLLRAGYETYHLHYMRDNPELWRYVRQRGVKVISPIREPVRRNISAFFQNYYHKRPLHLRDFLYQYPHEIPLEWFDQEFKKWWGVDVYAEPFGSNGWKVYGKKVLVIRTRDIDMNWPLAFHALSGKDAPKLCRENVRQLDEYLRFLREETIPQSYINMMHNSKFYRHFFS